MRYKYNMYKTDTDIVVNSTKFSFYINIENKKIFISTAIPKITIKHQTKKYQLINDVDLLFDENLSTCLLEAIQRYLYYLNDKYDKYHFGIDYYYRIKITDNRRNMIKLILEDINKKYNNENKEYFKYDLDNKEFILQMLNYSQDILNKISNELQEDKEIFSFCLKKYGMNHIYQKKIYSNKELFKLMLEIKTRGTFRINKTFVDDEIVDLLIKNNYKIEKITFLTDKKKN